MKLLNKSGNNLSHTLIVKNEPKVYLLANGKHADVPQEIAEIWLKFNGVEKYIEPQDLEKAAKEAEEKSQTELEALKKENTELKKKIADLEKAAKEAKTTKTTKTSK